MRGQRVQHHYAAATQHRARSRRVLWGIVIVVVVVGLALGAGFLAFRGSIGSSLELKGSDAKNALAATRSDEPYYALIAVDLGAVAVPLDHAGPDVLFLARVDRDAQTLSLVCIPAGLQVVTDNGARRVADLAEQGDATLIQTLANFAKVDISHYVKVRKGGLEGIVDALDGVEVYIDQVIDDPHAGDVYLPVGDYTLNGASALTYLRASNLKLGVQDQLNHQASFASLLLEKLFSSEGVFQRRLESIDSYFQTDLSLGDIEALQSWLSSKSAADIPCVVLPGYLTEVTGVVDTEDALYIASSDDMAAIIAALESGSAPDTTSSSDVKPADPASFTVEVQNGTEIAGAAAVTADALKAAGFNVAAMGNAKQQIYTETLVVYKGAEGPSRAKAVIDALGVGRAIDADIYYTFDTDILVIIGSDFKPFT